MGLPRFVANISSATYPNTIFLILFYTHELPYTRSGCIGSHFGYCKKREFQAKCWSDFCQIIFKLIGLFLFRFVLFKQHFTEKTFGLGRFETRIVRLEGEHAGHQVDHRDHHHHYRTIILKLNYQSTLFNIWVVVVAQLEERSLPTPEIHGSNPDSGKLYLHSTVLKRRQ